MDIEISKNVKFILKLQSVFKEIWKLIKERVRTSMRAVNAYEIGSDRRMFDKDANCLETQEFGCMNNFDLEGSMCKESYSTAPTRRAGTMK